MINLEQFDPRKKALTKTVEGSASRESADGVSRQRELHRTYHFRAGDPKAAAASRYLPSARVKGQRSATSENQNHISAPSFIVGDVFRITIYIQSRCMTIVGLKFMGKMMQSVYFYARHPAQIWLNRQLTDSRSIWYFHKR